MNPSRKHRELAHNLDPQYKSRSREPEPDRDLGPEWDRGLEPTENSTTEALVLAARRLFARYGYDGTSVRAITTEAGANLGAITYHFGSKRALYDRVLESVVGSLVERILAAAQNPGDVFDRMEAIVRAYFEHLAEYPDTLRLMMQELVLGGPPPEIALRQIRVVHGALTALLQEGQRSGSIRAGNAAVMSVSIVSQPVHMMLMRWPLQALTGLDLGDPPVREQFTASAVAFVRGGLARMPGGTT